MVSQFESEYAYSTKRKKENMYTLRTKTDEPVLRNLTGEPFTYSSLVLAKIGKRALEADRKGSYVISAVE